MIVALGMLLGCGSPTPRPVFESLDVRPGETVHFERVPAAVRLETLRTSLVVGGAGHRAEGRFVLTWDDGATEIHEGPLALGACSRGFEFTLDGMDRLASIQAEGPERPCPR